MYILKLTILKYSNYYGQTALTVFEQNYIVIKNKTVTPSVWKKYVFISCITFVVISAVRTINTHSKPILVQL